MHSTFLSVDGALGRTQSLALHLSPSASHIVGKYQALGLDSLNRFEASFHLFYRLLLRLKLALSRMSWMGKRAQKWFNDLVLSTSILRVQLMQAAVREWIHVAATEVFA